MKLDIFKYTEIHAVILQEPAIMFHTSRILTSPCCSARTRLSLMLQSLPSLISSCQDTRGKVALVVCGLLRRTPINLPDSNRNFPQEHDVTITASEDLNLLRHSGASSSSQHSAASTVPIFVESGFIRDLPQETVGRLRFCCKSDWHQGDLCGHGS